MSWVRGIPVDEAYEMMTTARRCSPKIQAIRSATADLLLGIGPVPATITISKPGAATKFQVGLVESISLTRALTWPVPIPCVGGWS